MDHFLKIYTDHAEEYHRLISAEDVDGQLLTTLEAITPLAGKSVLDLGTGTGRLPLLISGRTRQLFGLDLHRAMLLENRLHRLMSGGYWSLIQGDIRRLPFASARFDIVTAGWALGHFRSWFDPDWREQIGRGVAEILRVTAPGGAAIVIETLGTGSLDPGPPTPGLSEYYAWLEGEWGFHRRTIRTDYDFGTVESAVTNTSFFFGPELANQIRRQSWSRLPEWTGVWSRQV